VLIAPPPRRESSVREFEFRSSRSKRVTWKLDPESFKRLRAGSENEDSG
jgi:hypothetical protein